MPQRCLACGGAASLRCSRCRFAYYCCAAHQRSDYAVHKEECRVEEAVARGLATYASSAEDSSSSSTEVTVSSSSEPPPRCFVCLESRGAMRGGCGCRGSAGAVHVDCLVKLKAARVLECPVCKVDFQGSVALDLAARSWRAQRRSPGELAASHVLSYVLVAARETDAAERLRRRLLDETTRQFGPRHANARLNAVELARLLVQQDKNDEAIELLEKTYWDSTNDRAGARVYATALLGRGDYAKAEAILRSALDLVKSDKRNALTLELRAQLGVALFYQGRNREAVAITNDVYLASTRVFGPQHPWTNELRGKLHAMRRSTSAESTTTATSIDVPLAD